MVDSIIPTYMTHVQVLSSQLSAGGNEIGSEVVYYTPGIGKIVPRNVTLLV